MGIGVTVARLTLNQLVKVRILDPQLFVKVVRITKDESQQAKQILKYPDESLPLLLPIEQASTNESGTRSVKTSC